MSDTAEAPPSVADDETEMIPTSPTVFCPAVVDENPHLEQLRPSVDAMNDSDELNVTEKLAISDSDGDEPTPTTVADDLETDITSTKVSAPVPAQQTAQKRLLTIVDSDTDEESAPMPSVIRQTFPDDSDADEAQPKAIHKRVPGIVDSDSDGEPRKRAAKNSAFASSSENGGDSDDDNNDRHSAKATMKNRKKSASSMPASQKLANQLCDTSSDDEDYAAPHEDNNDRGTAAKKPAVARPPKRASAREAEDQMKTIQSESQRLAREASLSVPYHRPKQHSLQTFLSRRTVTKPTDVRPDAKKAAASIKMTHEELEKYAAHLDERAKESELFYKSDASDGEEMVLETEPKSAPTTVAETVADDDGAAVVASTLNDDNLLSAQPSESPAAVEDPTDTAPPPPTRLELLQERVRAQLNSTSDIGLLSPSLRGTANTIIDLDSGDVMPAPPPTGPIELYQRFLQHSARPSTKKAAATAGCGSLRILSADSSGMSMDTAVYSAGGGGGVSEEVIQDSKPRSAFFKLKAALGEKLAQKRREVIRERQREADEVHGKDCYSESDEEGVDDEKAIDDEEEADEKEVDKDPENEQDDQTLNEVAETADPPDDVEVEDDDASDDESDDSASDLPKIRKRIVQPDDSDDDNNEANAPVVPMVPLMSADPSPDMDDMLNVCSTLSAPSAVDNSVSFMTQNANVSDSQLLDLCSGAFMTQAPSDGPTEMVEDDVETDAVAVNRAFESSDEEEDEAGAKPKAPKLPTVKPKIVPLSDDEEDDPVAAAAVDNDEPRDVEYDSEENEIAADKKTKPAREAEDSSDDEEAIADDAPIADVEYDSEENEIQVVQRTANKSERRRRAGAFIENEAELSESEWGSSDEDEQHMDNMDAEFGDGEQFDDDKLREELATIHTRRMLDDDARAVKHIAAELLHEEDAEGDQRDRQFKWKNMNDTNWASDELARSAGDADGADGTTQRDSDEENEEAWRKMRYERETMLKDMDRTATAAAAANGSTPLDGQENEALNGAMRKRKITVIRGATNTPQPVDMKPSSFLIGQAKTELQGTRNSFLARDEQTLSRLATMIKNDEDGEGGVVGRAAGVTKGHGNFLFSTVSPTKQSGKRKSNANGGDETASKRQKKVGDDDGARRTTSNAAGGVLKQRLLDSLT